MRKVFVETSPLIHAVSLKSSLVGVFSMVAMINIMFLSFSLFLTGYTGVSVLEGKITPGETFEGDFVVNNTEYLTLIFDAFSTSNSEWLSVTLTDPNGDTKSWEKFFSIPKGGGQATDSTMILTPQLIGKYHITITDAKFPTNLRIKSGMINPTKNVLIFVGAWIFCFIVLIAIAKWRIDFSWSKNGFLIALPISLVATYTVIYYSSM
jgi:hypothetical protein